MLIKLKKFLFVILIVFTSFFQKLAAQAVSNIKQLELSLTKDTLLMDSLSLVPNSEIILLNASVLNENDYEINYSKGLFIVKNKTLLGQKVFCTFRSLPYSFTKEYAHKKAVIHETNNLSKNPFLFQYSTQKEDLFYLNGLNKSGSISRGVVFGNNQDLAVNSSLNLQLSGKISDEINISASISDDNIPIQAEGNTQQIQDFDRVFVQLFSDSWKLTAGDFYLERPKSYFMNFNKKVKGGSFELKLKTQKNNEFNTLRPIVSAALSKGKFARNKIQGIEGNQGPYRLTGAENELFIVVLSGTEKIYVDGKLMTRGNDFDYIIDYNTAELIFTTNKLITKDSRIVSEFQYSDKNYARSLVHFGTDFKSKKLTLNVNVYTEQDSKNQPLQQDLTDTDKLLLFDIGDSLQHAVVSNVTAVDFSDNLVLYKLRDTLGYSPVYVYSTNEDSAIYQLGFSYLGANKGNYYQLQSSANGKVYEWIAPIGGVMQGDYEPVVLLITPKTKQMATFGGQYDFSKESFISWEGGVSNNDINTFSTKDKSDNIGYAFKLNTQHKINLNKDKLPLKFKVGTAYEFIDSYFTAIERFRAVEFERNWNVSNLNFVSDRHVFNAFLGLEKKNKGDVSFGLSVLKNQGEYDGLKNSLVAVYHLKGFTLNGDVSYLTTKGINNTKFVKHKMMLTKDIKWLVLGVEEETERNQFFINQLSDSLSASSFEFNSWSAFIQNADTTINKFLLSYKQRADQAPLGTDFAATTFAEDITFSMDLLKNRNHKFRSKLTYRKLAILSTHLSLLAPEENILARVEYVAKILKGTIASNTYYEVGSGLEVKKEFAYVEVQPGQGTHAYLADLNGNGVKDLNEFEIAMFQDQATFIKVFTPTNDYVRTFTNQFNQGIFLRPESKWGNEKGLKKWIARFSNRTNYRISRKVSDKEDYYNPFIGDVEDTSLVTLTYGFLNTIYFNRTGTKFGTQFTFQDNRDRSLLTNGVESRKNLNRALKSRWNITRIYTLSLLTANGLKSSVSAFFSNRNFEIDLIEAEPKFTIQPSSTFRISFFYNYQEKTNADLYGGEALIAQKGGVELRYNVASKGSFRASLTSINNDYKSSNNASLTYEMLEGLQPGSNMTWEMTYQRNISKHMQLNINYNGRMSEETPVIHTGGVQVRAFF
jgi:hypothetical protein